MLDRLALNMFSFRATIVCDLKIDLVACKTKLTILFRIAGLCIDTKQRHEGYTYVQQQTGRVRRTDIDF